jgi:hypothetical protein
MKNGRESVVEGRGKGNEGGGEGKSVPIHIYILLSLFSLFLCHTRPFFVPSHTRAQEEHATALSQLEAAQHQAHALEQALRMRSEQVAALQAEAAGAERAGREAAAAALEEERERVAMLEARVGEMETLRAEVRECMDGWMGVDGDGDGCVLDWMVERVVGRLVGW